MRTATALVAGYLFAFLAGGAAAEPVSVAALLAPTEQMRMDFEGSSRFVLLVRREGTAEEGATPPFEGATIVEHGWHDVDPPSGGDPQGYLTVTTTDGDIAYLKFTVRAVFFGGGEKPRLADHGFWELVSGTGQFSDARGVGTVVLEPKGEQGTRFVLEGEIGAAP